ncbi:MAG: sulfotransferase, partial [Candidatus Aminicenantes bacterium]|nr:sulfotransferase [Candidatus Aminicenantes bacterium]
MSGTTHLHNLLLLDPEFAAPTLLQVFFPHSFLLTERVFSRTLGSRLPKTRGFDNVELGLGTPQEEELALCSLGVPSTYMILLLPQRVDEYAKYLSLRELPSDGVERWKSIYVKYLRKLTFRFGRRLALKSSPNTARIQTLLELFPDARFVHISRHPYSLFQSYRT